MNWGWEASGPVRVIRADMHIHTCLSPCAGYDVSPAAVVSRAAECGLALIAVCDHNSAENAGAAREAALRLHGGPHVLAGMEVSTAEEAHLLALFENLSDALALQSMVYRHLHPGLNNPAVFGEQVVVNSNDEVESFNPRLLIGSTDLGVDQWVERVHGLGGCVIASHIDRQAFSLVGQLGLIPPGLDLDAVEVSPAADPAGAGGLAGPGGLAVVTSSDAHCLADIGRVWTELTVERPSLAELIMALRGVKGRMVSGWGKREQ